MILIFLPVRERLEIQFEIAARYLLHGICKNVISKKQIIFNHLELLNECFFFYKCFLVKIRLAGNPAGSLFLLLILSKKTFRSNVAFVEIHGAFLNGIKGDFIKNEEIK